VEEIKKLHEQVKARIENSNLSYQTHTNKHKKKVIFQPGDLVWIHFRKERVLSKSKSKLMRKVDGPFKVLELLNDNAY